MCLIVCSWSPDKSHPFVLLSNRDEYHWRPTLRAHWWADHNSQIFAGRDLLSGGTWLGTNQQGKLATTTNYREPDNPKITQSRGLLTADFLRSPLSAPDYLQQLIKTSHLFSGFNLLLLDETGLWYATNRQKDHKLCIQQLKPGVYALCNHLLDSPWPKLMRAKKKFTQTLANDQIDYQRMIQLMQDTWQPNDTDLPETGMPFEYEKLRAPCFIKSPEYGTQFTSLIKMNSNNTTQWIEQAYSHDGTPVEKITTELVLDNTKK